MLVWAAGYNPTPLCALGREVGGGARETGGGLGSGGLPSGDRVWPPTALCGPRFSALGLLWALAVKMAVEEINNGSALLPGLRLGCDLFDTCSEPVVAMKPSLMFMAKAGSCDIAAYCNYTQYQPRVLAVIGPHSSELALVTGKFFSFFLMPQVCPRPPGAPGPRRPHPQEAPPQELVAVPADQLRGQHRPAERPANLPVLLPHGAQRPLAGRGYGGAAAGARLELGGCGGQ